MFDLTRFRNAQFYENVFKLFGQGWVILWLQSIFIDKLYTCLPLLVWSYNRSKRFKSTEFYENTFFTLVCHFLWLVCDFLQLFTQICVFSALVSHFFSLVYDFLLLFSQVCDFFFTSLSLFFTSLSLFGTFFHKFVSNLH